MTDPEITCRGCGKEVHRTDSFCPKCGRKLEWTVEEIPETKVKKPILTTLIVILRWLLGIFFALLFLGSLIDHGYVAAIFSLLAFFILIPPFTEIIEKILKINFSGTTITILVIVFFIGFGVTAPPHTSNNNAAGVSTNHAQTFENQLTDEIKDSQHITVDPSDINYEKTKKSISIQLQGTPDLIGNELYRKSLIKHTFMIMAVLVKHPNDIYMISFYAKLPTKDANGKKDTTLVYSAITNMDDAKSINWENLKNSPDLMGALKSNSNMAYEFSYLIQD